jgi:hypothetical protein
MNETIVNEGYITVTPKPIKFREGNTEALTVIMKGGKYGFAVYNQDVDSCNIIATDDITALAANFGEDNIGPEISKLQPGESYDYKMSGDRVLWVRLY